PDLITDGDGTTLDLSGALLQAAGTARANVFDLASGKISFVFKQQTVDVNADGNATFTPGVAPGGGPIRGPPDLQNGTLTTLGLSIDPVEGLRVGVPSGPGFFVASGTLALAVVTPSAADQANGDSRSWLALISDSLTASLQNVPGVTANATNLVVEINRASGTYHDAASGNNFD